MKTLLISIIIICTAVSCATQRNQNINGEVVGLEKYNSKTFTLVDFLNRDKIPDVLRSYYYNDLGEQDFYTPQSIISKSDNTRTIHLKSKKAKEGYLYINKYSNDFVTNYENIIYIIGKDTINSKEDVMRLIEMKRSEVVKVDTVKGEVYNLIRIN
ncbi:MAG: hypothetical protein A2W90_21390 [Bacteroidetes bacterium GWF2_42_66]|nr:MAG: hypothetical protein A2W92_06485 [Bacteroidetes bacterium GWA2_42_15]OFX98888.1 MAG: hypothetical protein A2W89_13025 [Bacteroidetes bacterium GWE2_42_39]OFY45603.1 MAG: hypothetical protein A2W90_21390 [Bacteroidetes bacterium GWF2_42_66]HBL77417.1 hypothetical protein [Prolixibacteraceae bacterium]HCU62419.1 hypothetical protein [Prolixibacteraceae bacterium]